MFSISFQTMYSINCGSTYLDKHSLQNQSPCGIVSLSLLLIHLVCFVSVLPFSKTNFRNSIKYQFLQSPAFAPHCQPKEKISSMSPAIWGTFAVKIIGSLAKPPASPQFKGEVGIYIDWCIIYMVFAV